VRNSISVWHTQSGSDGWALTRIEGSRREQSGSRAGADGSWRELISNSVGNNPSWLAPPSVILSSTGSQGSMSRSAISASSVLILGLFCPAGTGCDKLCYLKWSWSWYFVFFFPFSLASILSWNRELLRWDSCYGFKMQPHLLLQPLYPRRIPVLIAVDSNLAL
jgi:hypothetical protein